MKTKAKKTCRYHVLYARLRDKIAGELREGTYRRQCDRKTWEGFRQELDTRILGGLEPSTRQLAVDALDHFQRIIKPARMVSIKTQAIDTYRAKRRTERGRRKGDSVSAATINKELRHLRAALRKACKWGYLPAMPDFEFEREIKKLPTYVSPEHFAAMYKACEAARLPKDQPYPAADWWRALLVMGYMTGWRISDMLGLRREDLDMRKGTAVTRAEDNKAKRDELVALHPVVVEHVGRLISFDPCVFPWNYDRRTLQTQFARIQEAAGVHLPCHKDHCHSRYCHVYGSTIYEGPSQQ